MTKQSRKYKWVVFTAVLSTYLFMSSQRTAPGLVTEQIMADFNMQATTFGLLTSIQFFVYAVLQVPMGILADRYGPNFFLIAGATLTGVGTIFTVLAHMNLYCFLLEF